jgi:MoaA/NifB/PqqE/SkfB family radical SAM enzyme
VNEIGKGTGFERARLQPRRLSAQKLPARCLCGGARARAYALTGDAFAEEPRCTFQPWQDAEKRGFRSP